MSENKSNLSLKPVDDWTQEERRLFLQTINVKRWRLEHFYKIKDKNRNTVNLILNPIQDMYFKERTNRDYILKARKIGFSTMCLIDDLDDVIANENFTACIIAHRMDDVQKLFQIIHFAYDRMPEEWKPKAEYYNRNELFFKDRNSRIYVGMEARSDVVNKIHVSEFAFIEDCEKKMASTFEAVPESGSIVLETTPNGIGGFAYDVYQDAAGYKTSENGRSEFKAFFYSWFKHPEYRIELTQEERSQIEHGNYLTPDEYTFKDSNGLSFEQMKWRKIKKARLGDQFDEQYPEDDISCFLGSGQNYFDLKCLMNQLQPKDAINANAH